MNDKAKHRDATLTWRKSAGEKYSCGRRDLSPKSGVVTMGKSSTQNAWRTSVCGLNSGVTIVNALPCRLQNVSFDRNSIARFVKNDYYRGLVSLAAQADGGDVVGIMLQVGMSLCTGLCCMCWLSERRWAAERAGTMSRKMASEEPKRLGSLPAEGLLSAGTEFADVRCQDFG